MPIRSGDQRRAKLPLALVVDARAPGVGAAEDDLDPVAPARAHLAVDGDAVAAEHGVPGEVQGDVGVDPLGLVMVRVAVAAAGAMPIVSAVAAATTGRRYRICVARFLGCLRG